MMPADLFSKPTIQESFERFHEANPKVYSLFVFYARLALEAGVTRYSADALLHRIRWHLDVETTGGGGFRINNNYSSRYARKLLAEDPRFEGFFALRDLRH